MSTPPAPSSVDVPPSPWAVDADVLLTSLRTSASGLTDAEAALRLDRTDSIHAPRRMAEWRLIVRQVNNPIVLLLLGATLLSMALGDSTDGIIILVITLASGTLGYFQERGAVRTVEDLMARIRVHSDVLRSGVAKEVAIDDVVVGDVMVLRAGDVIAGDALVLTSDSMLVDESALTGESFPVEKRPTVLDAGVGLGERTNMLWCGTHVVSGQGTAVVTSVGSKTEYGRVGARLDQAHVPTAFELGLRRFGAMLMRTTGLLVVALFVINIVLHRPVIESLLFSLALAVGLTPQLLPTIVSVTLSYGAHHMAQRSVIVKRLDAIEDIGSIDVLCTDKTGTLTTGTVTLSGAFDGDGHDAPRVRSLAHLNATHQHSFGNPIDEALLALTVEPIASSVTAIDELPYDFQRRMLSVLLDLDGEPTLVTKGAFDPVLAACDADPASIERWRAKFLELSSLGHRVLGVATMTYAAGEGPTELRPEHEHGLHFEGFLCFTDPPKADAAKAIAELLSLGVVTKVITGDNRYAAAHAAQAVGVSLEHMLTGDVVATLTDDQLVIAANQATVFAEIDPLQKESIVSALRRGGHSVGYMGDGINDAPSMRAADVGISVDTAVDVAKHAASVVLLDKDLAVLAEGIRQGRRVFANTLKYVKVTISANFGNMLSMAAASVVLPFLPLLPRQILLLNFLSDIPGMTIAADRVDPEMVADPHGWDVRRLRTFMVVFGLVSSVFDITTFAILRLVLHADADLFRTGWFIESTVTELAVMLVLRTRRRPWRSRPGKALAYSSAAVAAITVWLPFSPLNTDLGLVTPAWTLVVTLIGVTIAYVTATEIAKRFTDRTP